MGDEEINDVRRIRREISARFGHDLHRLGSHYRELEQELLATGQYRFATPGRVRPIRATSERRPRKTG